MVAKFSNAPKLDHTHPHYSTLLRIAKDRMSRSNPFAARMIQDGQISDRAILMNLSFCFHDKTLLDMLIETYEKLGDPPYAVNSKTVNAGE